MPPSAVAAALFPTPPGTPWLLRRRVDGIFPAAGSRRRGPAALACLTRWRCARARARASARTARSASACSPRTTFVAVPVEQVLGVGGRVHQNSELQRLQVSPVASVRCESHRRYPRHARAGRSTCCPRRARQPGPSGARRTLTSSLSSSACSCFEEHGVGDGGGLGGDVASRPSAPKPPASMRPSSPQLRTRLQPALVSQAPFPSAVDAAVLARHRTASGARRQPRSASPWSPRAESPPRAQRWRACAEVGIASPMARQLSPIERRLCRVVRARDGPCPSRLRRRFRVDAFRFIVESSGTRRDRARRLAPSTAAALAAAPRPVTIWTAARDRRASVRRRWSACPTQRALRISRTSTWKPGDAVVLILRRERRRRRRPTNAARAPARRRTTGARRIAPLSILVRLASAVVLVLVAVLRLRRSNPMHARKSAEAASGVDAALAVAPPLRPPLPR